MCIAHCGWIFQMENPARFANLGATAEKSATNHTQTVVHNIK